MEEEKNNDGVMSESEDEFEKEYYKEYEAVKEDIISEGEEEDKLEEENNNIISGSSSSEDESEVENNKKINIIKENLLAESERLKKEIATLSKSVSFRKAKVATFKKKLAKNEHQLALLRCHYRRFFFRPQRMYLSQKKDGSAMPGLLKIRSLELLVG